MLDRAWRRDAAVLAAFDLRQALRGPRGILFLAIYGLVTGWFLAWLWRRGGEVAGAIDQLGQVAAMLDLGEALFARLRAQPLPLALYAQLAVALMPLWALVAGCDQTASDLGTRHIRFLLLRTSRLAVFAGRLLGAWLLCAAPVAAVTLAWGALVAASGRAPAGEAVAISLRLALGLAAYALALCAALALVAAATASVLVTSIVVPLWHLVVWMGASLLPLWSEHGRHVQWLYPSVVESYLVSPSWSAWAAGVALAIGYAAALFAAGAWVLLRRDV